MQEIEIGEYVRTEDGDIEKIKNNFMEWDNMRLENDEVINSRHIVKHSKNIIDLIEVGDYVNGEKVIETHKELGYIFVDKETELGTKTFCDYQIESIVTHEQFESIEYKI